jgi:hypothetical protein
LIILNWLKLRNKNNQPSEDASKDELHRFYDVELPKKVLTELRSFDLVERLGKYDALVVDEGQDHDTSLHTDVAKEFPEAVCGWWSIYWLLLHEQCAAPMALFYDCSQRPMFRAEKVSVLKRFVEASLSLRMFSYLMEPSKEAW